MLRTQMKPTGILLAAAMLIAATARAGDVKVDAYMTTTPEDKAVTSFTADTPKLYIMFKTKGATAGDKIRAVLIAEDVGDAAPANTKVLEKTLNLEGDTEDGDFNFSKPTNGWPTGKYRVEIYVNDQLATKLEFTIKAAKSKEQSDDEESSSDA
jgi:hypothetical protein